jgi:antitoxin HigA-1
MKSTLARAHTVCAAPHPGELLREHILPGLNLTVSQAARDLGISRQTLHRVLEGSIAITPSMAARLERLSGLPSMFWLCRQCEYDLCCAQVTLADVLPRIPRRTLPPELLMKFGVLDER